ncbi:MAG: enoyl-CoA hydratase/isomerase family protein [Syntrophales bacterium]|jgi:enoyl-CoA hydratase/carnithine racemase|nr:enoyl-CoA hydratase/isomerase family protein [Syntrophales bacterium]MCK9528427.1 enoyl-CoA hydratase/isomerase family protein [Syntrophales bacterium]MDX9922450.1 enoyl-CoA hydratase/isomerase family protein [Syntrophales bacterium]
MERVTWILNENTAILTMNSGENRLNLPFFDDMFKALDDIENTTDATALVIASSDSKIWCNGMDLEWLIPAIAAQDPDVNLFMKTQDQLFRRITFYPMITVAAVTGHAFAAGAILACACDFRYMRSDRGFLCFPEVDLHIPFLPYMDALIRRALPMHVVLEAELTGYRFPATELERHGIIRKACASAEETVQEAVSWAQSLNKKRGIVTAMKNVMNVEIKRLFDTTSPITIEDLSII